MGKLLLCMLMGAAATLAMTGDSPDGLMEAALMSARFLAEALAR